MSLGLSAADPAPMTAGELEQLENTLRYVAETQIPQFRKTTQEAVDAIAGISSDITTFSPDAPNSGLSIASDAITATKEIDYASLPHRRSQAHL